MTLRLFDLDFENVSLGAATELILSDASRRTKGLVVTPNVDHVVTLQGDAEMRRIYATARYRFADGMPIVWLSRLLYRRGLVARVTGADLLVSVAQAAAARGASMYFLGGLPGVAEAAAANLQQRFPGLPAIGTFSPPFGFESDEHQCRDIVAMINARRPDILFVGVGAPKQEKWLSRWLPDLDVGIALGVGAAFDFAAGIVSRAPVWAQRSGMEWLWRLASDPKRLWRRYLVKDSQFLWLAFREILKSRESSAG